MKFVIKLHVKKYKDFLKVSMNSIMNTLYNNSVEVSDFNLQKIPLSRFQVNKILLIHQSKLLKNLFTVNQGHTTHNNSLILWESHLKRFANFWKWETRQEDNLTLLKLIVLETFWEIVEFVWSMKRVAEVELWM